MALKDQLNDAVNKAKKIADSINTDKINDALEKNKDMANSIKEKIKIAPASIFKYFDFKGRASRSEFLYFTILFILTGILMVMAESFAFRIYRTIFDFLFIIFLCTLILYPALLVRRVHDINLSGWWSLIAFIPVVGLIFIILLCLKKGTNGDNRFGPQPQITKNSFTQIILKNKIITIIYTICLLIIATITIISNNDSDIYYYTKRYYFYIPSGNKPTIKLDVPEDSDRIEELKELAKEKYEFNMKWIERATRIVDAASIYAEDNKEIFTKQISEEIKHKLRMKTLQPEYEKQPELIEKLNKIGESLIEKIKDTNNKEEVIKMLATYLYILNNPRATIN